MKEIEARWKESNKRTNTIEWTKSEDERERERERAKNG